MDLIRLLIHSPGWFWLIGLGQDNHSNESVNCINKISVLKVVSAMAADVEVSKPTRCALDKNECVNVQDLLISYNSSLNEEHVWALCHQCVKCYRDYFNKANSDEGSNQRKVPVLVSALCHIKLHREGTVHEDTIFPENESGEFISL